MSMFDVSKKPDSLREAISRAIVRVDKRTISLINEGKSPKGDIVEAAKIAGTIAAKKTWELIPYCHPIPIDLVSVVVLLKEDFIEVNVKVKSVWKTGVEMEALTGASVAALTIYDMLKPIDSNISIESIRIVEKTGGISNFRKSIKNKLTAAIIVTSDSVSKGAKKDKSGKIVIEKLKELGFDIIDYKVISDDLHEIESCLNIACEQLKVNLIITVGGTGIGPRDVTPEATLRFIDKEVPGMSETIRSYGQRRMPLSMLSRGVAGIRAKTLIINLPGSVKGATESLDSLLPGLLHSFDIMNGLGH